MCLFLCTLVQGGSTLLAPDNLNLVIVGLNQSNGAMTVFPERPAGEWLNLTDYVDSWSVGTLRQATQVGSEIWISDQTAGLVYRFSAQSERPRFLGSIEGLANPRGITIVNGEVWIACGDLPPDGGVDRRTTNGAPIASFSAENPFDVLNFDASTVLVSNINQNRLEKYTSVGAQAGTFVSVWGSGSSIDFPMQLLKWREGTNDRIVAVGFTGDSPGLYVYKASDGSFVKRMLTIAIFSEVTVTDPRGAALLGSGEIAWSGSQGIFALDTTTGNSRSLYVGVNFTCNFISQVDFSKYCPGDINNDSLVDDSDFSIFVVAYNDLLCPMLPSGYPAGCPADLNGDGMVDDSDFAIFVSGYDALLCP